MQINLKHFVLTIILSLALFACKQGPLSPGYEPVPHFKVGGAYRIAGKTYSPKIEPLYAEKGTSSWYGDEFHMRRTANGEVFHKGDLTAAHRTLPLPSIVRVTNVANKKSAILRVNDRGPFAKSRIIDVSESAAKLLGFKNQGTAQVLVELLPKESFDALKSVKIKPEEYAVMQNQYILATQPKTQVVSHIRPPIKGKVAKGKKAAARNVPQSTAAEKPIARAASAAMPPVVASSRSNRIVAGTYSNLKIAEAQSAKLKKHFSTKIEQIKVDGASTYRLIVSDDQSLDSAKNKVTKLKALGFKNAQISNPK